MCLKCTESLIQLKDIFSEKRMTIARDKKVASLLKKKLQGETKA